MTHRQNRCRFTYMISLLILEAWRLGYELAIDDAKATTGHKVGSFHYAALAADFNLYIEGVYQEKTETHLPLGVFWESMNGSWGGRWGDGNHYSLGE